MRYLPFVHIERAGTFNPHERQVSVDRDIKKEANQMNNNRNKGVHESLKDWKEYLLGSTVT